MIDYEDGLIEGLNIAKDVIYWYDDLEVIKKKIKEKISLSNEIKMTYKKCKDCECQEIKSGLTEEQYRTLNKAMNQDIRRNGRKK